MNREIKFRFWDGLKMYTDGVYQIEKYSNPITGIVLNHLFYPFDGIESGEIITANAIKIESVQQYIGLKDKNGRGIYEGDIMNINLDKHKFFWGAKDLNKTGTVKYEPDFGSFIVEWEYSKNQHHEILDCDIAFTGEVIGNIYETPELLP